MSRTFVLSDIHGHYDTFLKMLEKIQFSEEDHLYILGDMIDRGKDGIAILQDIMKRKNVEAFLGNHEMMMLDCIEFERAQKNGAATDFVMMGRLDPYELWTYPSNGGTATYKGFYGLPQEEQDAIEEFLKELPLIKRIKVGKRSYHLSHSYSLSKRFGKELYYKKATRQQAERIVWESIFAEGELGLSPNCEKPFAYRRDIYIGGHIFTQRLGYVDEMGQGKILRCPDVRGYKVIDLDCGMAINGYSSRLGCMCLETGEEYYVALEDV